MFYMETLNVLPWGGRAEEPWFFVLAVTFQREMLSPLPVLFFVFFFKHILEKEHLQAFKDAWSLDQNKSFNWKLPKNQLTFVSGVQYSLWLRVSAAGFLI